MNIPFYDALLGPVSAEFWKHFFNTVPYRFLEHPLTIFVIENRGWRWVDPFHQKLFRHDFRSFQPAPGIVIYSTLSDAEMLGIPITRLRRA